MGILINIMQKPRQFNYRPLYYDERKERLDKIKANAALESAKEEAEKKIGLEKGFISETRVNSKRYSLKFEKTSVVRLLIALAIIGILYLLMPEFFTSLWRR